MGHNLPKGIRVSHASKNVSAYVCHMRQKSGKDFIHGVYREFSMIVNQMYEYLRIPRLTTSSSQAKTHEKVDSIGEERSIACHAVVMLIRKDQV